MSVSTQYLILPKELNRFERILLSGVQSVSGPPVASIFILLPDSSISGRISPLAAIEVYSPQAGVCVNRGTFTTVTIHFVGDLALIYAVQANRGPFLVD